MKRFWAKIFLAKRKVLTLISFMAVVAALVTINHFFFLDSERGGFSHNKIVKSPDESFRIGEEPIALSDLGRSSRYRPSELSVAEEIVRAKLVQNERRLKQSPNAISTTSRSIRDMMDEDDKIPVMNSDGTRYVPRRRVVHFDLKGAPPKVSLFKAIFPMIKSAGATTILMEYEDMFPFWGELKNVSAKNAYTKQDVKKIISMAKQNGLEVIPLIQTFGHMEFALKLGQFRELRESPDHPQALCPSNEKSWNLITSIIDQVLSFHPDAKWVHVGCDEVYQLAECPVCSERVQKMNSDPKNSNTYYNGRNLFLDHVHRVASYVRKEKKLKPIIWDDMLREIPEDTLLLSGIGDLVEPMVWVYIEDIDRFVDPLAWSTFGNVFRHIWTASAFKGAFGERLHRTNIERHVGNNVAWLEVMKRETVNSNNANFRGIALTGWSRYDHFAVLCELLPSSLPSLILNLAILQTGGHDTNAANLANKILQCGNTMSPMTREELMHNPDQWELQKCKFPGANLLSLLASYDMNQHEIENIYDKLTHQDGWMTDYNVKHRFSSVNHVNEQMRAVSYLPSTLRTLRSQVLEVLSQYYDDFTVKEWMEQHILPLEKMVEVLNDRANKLTSRSVWPRRPLTSDSKK